MSALTRRTILRAAAATAALGAPTALAHAAVADRPNDVRLRFLAWTEIGSDYAETPLEDHDWGDAGLLTILADAERLTG